MVTNEANKERKPGSHEYLHVFRERVGLWLHDHKISFPFTCFKGILWRFPLILYVLCNFSSSLLLFRSKLTDSRWGHSPRESLRNVCDCTQERNYEVNMCVFSGALDFINHVWAERELYNRNNKPKILCLECPASGMPLFPKMYKCECLLLLIFEAADTFWRSWEWTEDQRSLPK